MVPPQTDGTVVTPLSQYRDACYEHCMTAGCEMLNLLDGWGGYTTDLFTDSLHLNAAGASAYVGMANAAFLKL